MRSHIETFQPGQRLVLLGASNLSRAFPTVVSMSRQAFASPIDFYVAKGHGRSYGIESSCLGKKISGIFSCGIWRALAQEKSVPITAFVTDIGNDLAYEVPVDTVVQWVEASLDRLTSLGARIVVSDLPMDVLRRVQEARYRVFRAILFPQCRLPWSELLDRAEQLSAHLQQLAKEREIPFFVVRKEWFGLDPIHPRMTCYAALWSELLSLVVDGAGGSLPPRCPLLLAWQLRRLQPESWMWFSIPRRSTQPNGRLRDGSRISLY